jgi:hypothetical protein
MIIDPVCATVKALLDRLNIGIAGLNPDCSHVLRHKPTTPVNDIVKYEF